MNNPGEKQPFKSGFAAVIGRPNVGKSTLINALLDQKIAAVSPKPQTTRLNQLGILTDEESQIVFVDTPGLHEAKHALGAAMNVSAEEALRDVDVILWVVDVSEKPHSEDRLIAGLLKNYQPVIQVINKIDLIRDGEDLEKARKSYKKLLSSADQIMVSALQGAGFDVLRNCILSYIPHSPPYFPIEQVTDLYERDIAADLIREAALNHLRDEIPHSIAVRIDEYKERADSGAYITATIFIEKISQKGIVIGAGGRMLKKIGTSARLEIEAMSGRKIFLDLRVKVKKNWRTDPAFLRQMGYSTQKKD
jgi:GTP-binding protein Era